MVQQLRPAVFLDKDGTLIEDVPYNVDCSRIRLKLGAIEAVQALDEAGYAIVIVSNQSGVAHGYFEVAALARVEQHLRDLLAKAGVPMMGFYFCPHHPTGSVAAYTRTCDCRKPQPGMLLQAARELHLNLASSWMIGDILNDVEAGRRAGCRTILVDNGGETEWEISPLRRPDFVVRNLLEATETILGERTENYRRDASVRRPTHA